MGGVCVDPRLPCLLWLGLPASYTAYLLTLAARRASRPVVPEPAVSSWDHVQSPMSADVWEEHLHDQPDRAYCAYLVDGFRIGFRYGERDCRSAVSNMQSAVAHPEVVSRFLLAEVRAGRVLGPVRQDVAASIHVNRFGLVPKGHSQG